MKEGKIEVRNINHPGKTKSVDAKKYMEIRQAILKVLPTEPPGLNHAQLIKEIEPLISEELFPKGEKLGWWSKTVQLDLESRGFMTRLNTKPITWLLSINP